ncbi:hypothetical protein UK12_35290 [Saccharothrix sp. ST-888]|nr:hypothetical protein UK12_35290 [Saccharothrix sp. ST-888]
MPLIHERHPSRSRSDARRSRPALARASSTDAAGRGLCRVAQLAQSRETRYTAGGKVNWAECALEEPWHAPDILASWPEEIPGIE